MGFCLMFFFFTIYLHKTSLPPEDKETNIKKGIKMYLVLTLGINKFKVIPKIHRIE